MNERDQGKDPRSGLMLLPVRVTYTAFLAIKWERPPLKITYTMCIIVCIRRDFLSWTRGYKRIMLCSAEKEK